MISNKTNLIFLLLTLTLCVSRAHALNAIYTRADFDDTKGQSLTIDGALEMRNLAALANETWEFAASDRVVLKNGFRAMRNSNVRVRTKNCGHMSSSCCGVSPQCSTGLTCLSGVCVQGAQGWVSHNWGAGEQTRCLDVDKLHNDNLRDHLERMSNLDSKIRAEDPDGDRLPPDCINGEGHDGVSCSKFPELDELTNHVQGVGRYPGYIFRNKPGEEMLTNFLVATVNDEGGDYYNGDSVLFLVAIPDQDQSGKAFEQNFVSPKPDPVASFRSNTDHLGGMQVFGKYVIASSEGEEIPNPNNPWEPNRLNPWIHIWDLSDLADILQPQNSRLTSRDVRIAQLNLWKDINYPDNVKQVSSRTAGAAAIRLRSGRYLLAVTDGSGDEENTELWMYLSNQRTLSSSTTWKFHSYVNHDNTIEQVNNANFYVDCNGQTSIALFGNSDPAYESVDGNSGGGNEIQLWNMSVNNSGKFSFSWGTNCSDKSCVAAGFQDGDYCAFRMAGGLYVDTDGLPVIYCVGRDLSRQSENYWFGEHYDCDNNCS